MLGRSGKMPTTAPTTTSATGTTTLFAALEIATGTVTGLCKDRHRNREFLGFDKVKCAQPILSGTSSKLVIGVDSGQSVQLCVGPPRAGAWQAANAAWRIVRLLATSPPAPRLSPR